MRNVDACHDEEIGKHDRTGNGGNMNSSLGVFRFKAITREASDSRVRFAADDEDIIAIGSLEVFDDTESEDGSLASLKRQQQNRRQAQHRGRLSPATTEELLNVGGTHRHHHDHHSVDIHCPETAQKHSTQKHSTNIFELNCYEKLDHPVSNMADDVETLEFFPSDISVTSDCLNVSSDSSFHTATSDKYICVMNTSNKTNIINGTELPHNSNDEKMNTTIKSANSASFESSSSTATTISNDVEDFDTLNATIFQSIGGFYSV
jgi:hypothetical protein